MERGALRLLVMMRLRCAQPPRLREREILSCCAAH